MTRDPDDKETCFHLAAICSHHFLLKIMAVFLIVAAAACQQLPNIPETETTLPPLPTSVPTIELATVAYPVASPQPSPTPEPYSVNSPTFPLPAATNVTPITYVAQVYLPLLAEDALTIPPPTILPSPTVTPTPTPTPIIDFVAVRQQLQANGQDLGLVKIGFHTGLGGNLDGLATWMQRLDEAGVPIFLKSVDNAEPLWEAQNLMQSSGVPHTLVYRRSGNEYDVPDYSLAPQDAAAKHWALHKAVWPPELDPSLIWIETINEVDKNRAEWLAQFALTTAQLALADGFKWAAFGWASGEPAIEDWQSPAMLAFLRFAAANPHHIAIALHEYSYITSDIAHEYPYKVGRFQSLFQVCDENSIPRPTVLITEWGWEYVNVPSVDEAMSDIAWAAQMYAAYPQIKGAAIWFLGGLFNDIHNQTQRLITPLTEYSLSNYFTIPLSPAQTTIDPEQFRPLVSTP